MEYTIQNHRECIGCSKNGFLIAGFHLSELGRQIDAELLMGDHTEGWVGVPHGGIGMGTMVELAQGLSNYPKEEIDCFPYTADFRLGGTKLKIGDKARIRMTAVGNSAEGVIRLADEMDPYLTAKITINREYEKAIPELAAYIPTHYSETEKNTITLPRYKHCFVCGDRRIHHGLNREFSLMIGNKGKVVFTKAGFNPQDNDDFFWFKCDRKVHPVAQLGLLDETMGWAGFFISAQGGVTVKLRVTFLRNIMVGEKIFCFGRAEKISGKNPRLMFFWSSGGIAAVNDNGELEIIAFSSAQYLAVPELTDQMKIYLHPEDSTRRAFEFAGNHAAL
jgi:hypothetical protein